MKTTHTRGTARAVRMRENRIARTQADRTQAVRSASASAHKVRHGGKSAGGRGLAIGTINYIGHGDYSQRVRKSIDKYAIGKVMRRRMVDDIMADIEASIARRKETS